MLAGQDKTGRLDSLFTEAFKANVFNGNVLIAEKGEVIFKKSFGLADEINKTKLTEYFVFDLGSVSKQFTAMGIVLLQKQMKLNYDDKLSLYIPGLYYYQGVTIKNLLQHTGGLPDYMELFEDNWNKSRFATNEDIIHQLIKYKPAKLFDPGQRYEYSNTGYTLLASVIERVSGKKFGHFLHDNIFAPLTMTNTRVYQGRYNPQPIENYALGYITDSLNHKILPDDLGKDFYTFYLDGVVGDGLISSTTTDLLKWDRALYTDQLVIASDKELLFNQGVKMEDQNTRYGFGWIIEDNPVFGKIVYHSGNWAGYISHIERHIDTDKTIILLQNNFSEKTSVPVKEICEILYDH